ncbi:MAG: aminomethyl-transferring glycine dehydrogenase subunit GcvPB [Deltaproteobacteria bacterium]|nr:aminomethyl-transferring glycine dehydrogenase subunit GcvPB [Deltaproteobacteria bacterium]
MKKSALETGMINEEPLLWEKGQKGRCAFSMPTRDVKRVPLSPELEGDVPDLPELSEVDLARHYTRLSQWNIGIDTGMYPLGSCTMKYNPKINDRCAGLEGFSGAHPFSPEDRSQGMLNLMFRLGEFLKAISGMDAVSLQPAAGAQGELTGMLMIRAYHRARNEDRSTIIVPDTAHGTNPASAALCGFKPVAVQSNDSGILAAEAVAEVMGEETAGIMVTNPNTLGFFEENIHEIAEIVHAKGGLVYCDGANLNAVMGMVDMGRSGVDVLHLNLHKTFSTPHGGGGPGAGPVCVRETLEPFLPVPRIIEEEGQYRLSEDFPRSVGRVHAFYGNFGVMIRAYAYILSMGAQGLRKASQLAVLNANYVKERLKNDFHLPYDRACMHECVFSDQYQRPHKVTTLDMAKRLMDYGFHPPTIYFPLVVNGAIMVEPTETEPKEEIDHFIEACRAISEEARTDPERVREAPHRLRYRRMDETLAARRPCLTG